MINADQNYKANFFRPTYIINPTINPDNITGGSYIALFDYSETTTIEHAKKLCGPLTEFSDYENRDKKRAYKVLVKHTDKELWWNKINTHKSAFCDTSVLLPIFSTVDDWEFYSVMVLYCMSILVRYNPSI